MDRDVLPAEKRIFIRRNTIHNLHPVAHCRYCGLGTGSHRRMWIRHSSGVILAAVAHALIPNAVARTLLAAREHLAKWCINVLERRKIVIEKDGESIQIPRARALFTEAAKHDITMRVYTLLGKPLDYYSARFKNGRRISFFGLPRPPERRYKGERWMDDKIILKNKLIAANIPVPCGRGFSSFGRMRKVFSTLTKPVVVKPRRGSRGNHTTTYIYTESDLYRAYNIAKQVCHFVVMEEHLHGPVYRGTVIDGKVVGILAGEPPRITGDGIHTVTELIEEKNACRKPLVAPVVVTTNLLEFIGRSGYTLASILPQGVTIDLSDKIGVRNGGVSMECTPLVHPELLRTLEEAARIVDDSIIGFDFIIEDVTKDPRVGRWGIIEANSLPFIHLHNEPRIGTQNNVALHVWNLWK